MGRLLRLMSTIICVLYGIFFWIPVNVRTESALGEQCDTSLCQNGLFCVNGICSAAKGKLMDQCNHNNDCQTSLFCSSGVCKLRMGSACTDEDQCGDDAACDDGFCSCDDTHPSRQCAAEYGKTSDLDVEQNNWRCIEEEQDPDKSRAFLDFCVDTNFGDRYPLNSTDQVKYPVEQKILMGQPCDATDACLSRRSLADVCNETVLPSTESNDPWYQPGKKLQVCTANITLGVQEVCTQQYGKGDWVTVSGSGELSGLTVCQRSDGWTPTTLEEMRKYTPPSTGDAGVTTSIFGITTQVRPVDLVQPSPRIGIPGVLFSNISSESNIVTDDRGGVWLNVPFLGEYIAAIYKYSVGLISLVAVLVLIISGVQIVTSAGNSEVMSGAKHRITSSVVALILAAGSYTILYTVNPELVNLRGLKLSIVRQMPLAAVTEVSPTSYKAVTGQDLKLDPASREGNVELAIASARKAGLDPCFAYVIVRHESAGNPSAVGHDEDYPLSNGIGARYDFLKSGKRYQGSTFQSPSGLPSTREAYFGMDKTRREEINSSPIRNDDGASGNRKLADLGSPPDYGIDWRFSHGLGLGQITFGGNSYCDKSQGIRGYKSLSGRCFTIPELLTPEGGVDALVAKLQYYYPIAKRQVGYTGPDSDIPANSRQKYSQNNKSVVAWTFAMYGAGTGGGTLPRSSNDKRVDHFNECKSKGLEVAVPEDTKPKYLEPTTGEESQ